MNLQRHFVIYRQHNASDCGPACLRMVAHHYGKRYSHEQLRNLAGPSKNGISLSALANAAENIGLQTLAVKITFEQLDAEILLPCILYWRRKHYVVIPPQDYSADSPIDKILVADPSDGLIEMDKRTFLESWINPADDMGVALLLEPTDNFYTKEPEIFFNS